MDTDAVDSEVPRGSPFPGDNTRELIIPQQLEMQ